MALWAHRKSFCRFVIARKNSTGLRNDRRLYDFHSFFSVVSREETCPYLGILLGSSFRSVWVIK